MTGLLNEAERRRHKRRNRLQSVLLLAGMALLLAACGWIVAGGEGVAWALLAGAASLVFAPQVSPRLALRLYGAVPVAPADVPALFEVLAVLARRADLARVPAIYYVPSRIPNAFAVGRRDEAAIAVTDGLLRRLTKRELAGILAHEISHIRNDDLWVMGLADILNRLTAAMAFAGLVLLVASLPVLLDEASLVLWGLIGLLLLSPTLVNLLQLALSRTREYDADMDAAGLTGDPRGLASALAKLERDHGGLIETVFLPGRRIPHPSLLRTHPDTEARIARLLALEARPERSLAAGPRVVRVPARLGARPRGPRWHPTGLWY